MDELKYIEEFEACFEACEREIQAFVAEEGRFERLRREIRQLLDRYPHPLARPPLFGVLFGVKDILNVAGIQTRAESQLPAALFHGPEAESVARLKAAGALVLGKTITTEFGYFVPGPTRNPYNPEHTPGGSSSGSAAAVAAGLCSLALGTQTIGSIIRPAAFCGVVALKPTYSRVPSADMIPPLAPSLDSVGVFTPEVAGAGLAAPCLYDDWQLQRPAAGQPVLGIPEGSYLENASQEALVYFEEACQKLQTAGFTIKRVQAMPDFSQIRERHERIVAAEAARFHTAWIEAYGHLYSPRMVELIQQGQEVSDGELAAARAGRVRLRIELAGLMEAQAIDLWITPAAPGPAPYGLEATGDPVMNLPWSHAGLPTINLPSGLNADGLPMGLQVTGRWYADEALLAWAEALEKPLGWNQALELPCTQTALHL